ncbi:probable RAD50-interacting protein 1 [Coccomyxa sp. Obi]|nr:probable RAD50-interacting protein 1 [Coccomyxa sp. Obi]
MQPESTMQLHSNHQYPGSGMTYENGDSSIVRQHADVAASHTMAPAANTAPEHQQDSAAGSAVAANDISSPAFNAAARLRDLNNEIAALQAKEAEVRNAIAHQSALEKDRLRQSLTNQGDAVVGPGLPQDAPGLAGELNAIEGAKTYAHSLQELVAITKHLEKLLRACERAAAANDLQAFLSGVAEAVAAHSAAAEKCESVAQLPSAGVPLQLCELADGSLARAAGAQDKLVTCLRGVLRQRLAAVGWPPPVTLGSGAANGSRNDNQEQWNGFQQTDPQALDDLNKIAAAFIALQRSVQRSSFEAGVQVSSEGETPELWAVEEVAAPITERLRAHFAAGRPTDRADRPEWLFETALRLVRQLAPATAPLQAALEVHGLGQVYHVPLEFARAIRNAVKGILREHVYPRLAKLANTALWLHAVEEAVSFERSLAPLRGLTMPVTSPELMESTAEPWNQGSCLELLATQPAWSTGWWTAEREEALRQLDELMDAPEAWQTAPSALGPTAEPDLDLMEDEPRSTEAWRSEFWPPGIAESALAIVTDLARKCAWLADPTARRQFAIAVPQEVLRKLLQRLTRLAKTAEDFRALTSPGWAPRIGAYTCAAHWLAHSLQEAAGPLLLLDLEDCSDGHGRGSVLAAKAEAFSSFKQKWTLKLAKALANSFNDATSAYRKRTNLEHFSSSGSDRRDGEVSLRLRPALESLSESLQNLSASLDAVVFSDTWRAAAIAITRTMFNDVATEARFSAEGAVQFQTDVSGLIAVFQPYTPRPAAHLRELAEACTLLTLEPDQAASVAANLAAMAPQDGAAQLKALGVARLTPDQALCVLSQRLF